VLRVLLVALLVAGVAALYTPAAWEGACTLARRELPRLTGLEVGMGRCELDPLRQRLVVHGLSLFEPGAELPLLVAEEAEVQLGLALPLGGQLALESLEVHRPRLRLDLARPVARAKDGRCALSPLQRLRIARLDIHEAQVHLALPQGHQVEVGELEVSWRERWGAEEFELEARRGLVRLGGEGREVALGRLFAAGALDPQQALLELDEAEVALEDLSVRTSGRVEQLCEPVLSLEAQLFLPLRLLQQLGWVKEPVEGQLWSRLQVSGRPESPRVSAEVAGSGLRYGRLTPGEMSARLTWEGRQLTVESLSIPVGKSGKLLANGRVDLGAKLPVTLELKAEGASFARVLEKAGVPGSWVDFSAKGNARLQGTLLPRPELQGEVDLSHERFTLATRPYDAPAEQGRTLLTYERGAARGQVRIGAERVLFSNVVLESAGSQVRGEASIPYESARGLKVSGQADLALEDFGAIAELPWAGRGSATFEVGGPPGQVQARAQVKLRDFKLWDFDLGVLEGRMSYQDGVLAFPSLGGQKGRTAYSGNAVLTFGRALHARAEVEVPHGRTEDIVDVLAGLHSNIALFQGPLVGSVSGRVELDSPVDRLEGLVALELKDTLYYGRQLGDGALRLQFVDGKTLVLERTVLEGPLGRTWAEATWNWREGELKGSFGGEALKLAELAGTQELEGALEVQGTLSGTTDAPVVEARISSSPVEKDDSPAMALQGRDLGRMELQGRLEGRELTASGVPVRGMACHRIHLRVREPYPYQVDCTVELPELRPLLPKEVVAWGLSGSLSGALHAQGGLLDSSTLEASMRVERLALARGDLTLQNVEPLGLRYRHKGRMLGVDPFALRGRDMELSGEGTVAPGSLDMVLRGTFGLRLLELLMPGVTGTGGQVQLQAKALGSLDQPALSGGLFISDAYMALRDQPVTLRGLSGSISFGEQLISIERLEGLLNEGRVQALGNVRLERLTPTTFNLEMELTGVSVRVVEDAPFTASGRLTLGGKLGALQLGGALQVEQLRYRKGLELEDILRRFARRVPQQSTPERSQESVLLDVSIDLKDVWLENNLAQAQLLGAVRLTGTDARTGVIGSVEVAAGSQAFFRNNSFLITRGRVDFTDRYSFDPVFDLRAQARVRDYLVMLHAFGRPDDPKLVLTSEPFLAEADIFSLLTLKVMSADRNAATDAGAGLAAEALFSSSGLDQQVQRFLPPATLLKDLSLRFSTTYNSATQQIEPTALLGSTLLDEQLKIDVAYPVSGRGTRAQAEYRLGESISGQAQWDNENNRTPLGNLGLQLKLDWHSD
jgi:translocation and assembly module TamB